ncbi:30S ribosome-binding factor RbfA [Thermohalobacter berrensis]|uniref:Ribosome-binding factor A n=1 Tax=Thermohalobacter berrensis TaxID=99594 RepID=A0A419TAG7_9FIRM|nr:30S ribosome-binding factor RbfA [Thermohalobacter berrensis]RKD34479.1 ribosome-binding factor A [Thermohalobacter berrensis]
MGSNRIARISEEVKKIVSKLIKHQLKDPRISPLTSITEVEVTNDLRYAKIYISVLGSNKEKENTIKGLENAKGYIRKEIGKNLKIRYTPEPIFELDRSIERGVYISKLIDKVSKRDKEKEEENDHEQ